MEFYSGQSGIEGEPTGPPRMSAPSVLDHVAVGIYSTDPEGRCTQLNAAAVRMLGYSEAECLGQNMHSLIHYRHADGSPYAVEDCPLAQTRLLRKPVYNIDETVWTKEGKPLRVSCSGMPILVNDQFQGTVVTLTDNSAQQHTESQLREVLRQRDAAARVESEQSRHQRDLAANMERAAAEQLRHQQRMAEDRLVQSEKLAAVGRLAASISHEINNPLEAVTNLLYLVRTDRGLSTQACDYILLAEQELARVSEIVAQTLRFQRTGAVPTACQPEALIESVVALHQGRLHHTGIKICREHRRSAPFVCPEGDIRQILNNLIGNAIDAMKEIGGIITVRTQPARDHATGREGLRITVSDSGHGMSNATASKIFEPFYTTKGASGSGLGLWISSSIAKRHNGRLSVRSSRDAKHRGTTFTLFMPQAEPIKQTIQ